MAGSTVGAAVKGRALSRAGALAGLLAGPFFLVLAVALRDQLPPGPASRFAVVTLVLLGAALMLAAFRVDEPMLSGGNPNTVNGWLHGIAFLLIIATGPFAPLSIAPAVRRDPGWRPLAVISVAASALFVVFLLLPWATPHFCWR